MTTEVFKNFAGTTLNGGINSTVTSILVADGSALPALSAGQIFRAVIDEAGAHEIILVTALSGNTLTAARGQEGSTAASHLDGTTITHGFSAATMTNLVQSGDPALTNARTPNGSAGGDLTGNYPNPTLGISGVTAATYGDATHVARVTLDAKGRATSASSVAIAIDGSQVTTGTVADARLSSNVVVMAPAPSGDTTGATDTAVLQAIHDGWTGDGAIQLQAGTYYAQGLVFTKRTLLIGKGADATTIATLSTTATVITVSDATFQARDVGIYNLATGTPTSGAGLVFSGVGSADHFDLDNVWIVGHYTNLDIQRGSEWRAVNCQFRDAANLCIKIRNLDAADAGDGSLVNCIVLPGVRNAAPAALIRWESGGALRLIGCKLNGSVTYKAALGLDWAIADGASTVDLIVSGNSIENFTDAGIKVHLAGPSNTGVFYNVAIVGNQFASYQGGTARAVAVTPEVSGKISSVLLGPNVISDTHTGYDLANVDLVTIIPGAYKSVTTPVNVGASVTNLTQLSNAGVATTSVGGIVEVDNNSGGAPVAITEAGYLSSITALTHSNLSSSAGVTLSQLGQSAATTGQVAAWNGSAWAPATSSASTHAEPLTDGTGNLIFANGDSITVVGVPN